jgi:hypothetical protein
MVEHQPDLQILTIKAKISNFSVHDCAIAQLTLGESAVDVVNFLAMFGFAVAFAHLCSTSTLQS